MVMSCIRVVIFTSCVLLCCVLVNATHSVSYPLSEKLHRNGSTESGQQFRATYGSLFVWHAASAVLAWAIIAPLGHALSRVMKRVRSARYVRMHRAAMFLAVFLTVQTWALALVFAKRTPRTHIIFGSLVTVLTLLQVAGALARPSVDAGFTRKIWFFAHRTLGFGTLAVAAFTLHHSAFVFKLHNVWIVTITALLVCSFGVLVLVECITRAFMPPKQQQMPQEQHYAEGELLFSGDKLQQRDNSANCESANDQPEEEQRGAHIDEDEHARRTLTSHGDLSG